MDRHTGIKVYLIAAIFSITTGFSFLAAKEALRCAAPLESLFFRFAVAFIMALVLAGLRIIKIDFRGKSLKPLLIPAALYAGGFFGFQFFGLLYISSVEAGIIMAAQPAITALLAELCLKEKPNFAQRLCLIAAILATVFISLYGNGGAGEADPKGVLLIFLSAASMGANVVYIRWIRSDYTPAEISFVSCGLGFALYLVVILIYGGANGTLADTLGLIAEPRFVTAVAYLGIACTMLTTLFNSYMMKYLEAVKVSVFGCAGTVITLFAGFFILHESIGPLQILCSIIILAAIVGTNYFGRTGKKDAER